MKVSACLVCSAKDNDMPAEHIAATLIQMSFDDIELARSTICVEHQELGNVLNRAMNE